MSPEELSLENNLKAAIKYAELLQSHLSKSKSDKDYIAIRDLVLLIIEYLETKLVENLKLEINKQELWAEIIATLSSSVCNVLGVKIFFEPAEHQQICYYGIEFLHPQRGKIVIRISLPKLTSVEVYSRLLEKRIGAKLVSIVTLTEEEWLVKSKKRRKVIEASLPSELKFSDIECEYLEKFESTGALKAFEETYRLVISDFNQIPCVDVRRPFLAFLKTATPYNKIVEKAHEEFAAKFGENITYFHGNSVLAVLCDRKLKRFISLERYKKQDSGGDYGYIPKDKEINFYDLFAATGGFGREEVSGLSEVLSPPLDLTKVRFTKHAIERFVERFPEKNYGEPEKIALQILSGAKEKNAIDKAEMVKRVINNKFKEARYFKRGSCRFVVIENKEEDIFNVVTIERASNQI